MSAFGVSPLAHHIITGSKLKLIKKIFLSAVDFVKRIVDIFIEDKVSVYAAQATLFVIISVVPFISLLLSIVGIVLPNHPPEELLSTNISSGILEIVGHLIDDLKTAPSVSLLSISAIITLWCASRGITAVRDGIGSVYYSKPGRNYFSHRLISLAFTLAFVIFILALTMLVLFGDFLIEKLGGGLADLIIRFRTPSLIVVLSIFFTGLFAFVAQRSDKVKHNIFFHLPGGIFSAIGWVVFSYLYSLYITNFPSASYIYGGLAALCLIMLWLYFCMIILLAGSEINKLWFAGKERFLAKKESVNEIQNNQ